MPQCPICLESYEAPPSENAPVSLPCGHCVCRACVGNVQTGQVDGGELQLCCPVCRQHSPMPAGGIAALPCNYALVEMIQLVTQGGAAAAPPAQVDQLQPAHERLLQARVASLRAEHEAELRQRQAAFDVRCQAMEERLGEVEGRFAAAMGSPAAGKTLGGGAAGGGAAGGGAAMAPPSAFCTVTDKTGDGSIPSLDAEVNAKIAEGWQVLAGTMQTYCGARNDSHFASIAMVRPG